MIKLKEIDISNLLIQKIRKNIKNLILSFFQIKSGFWENGKRGVLDNFINEKNKWSIERYKKDIKKNSRSTNSSLSDYDDYLLLCQLASKNEKVFSKFKSCREYQDILEHVTYKQGIQYLELLEKDCGKIDQVTLDVIKENIGKPPRFTYKKYGKMSPTSLRYGRVTKQLTELFGNLDNFVISEIGVGYGGQAQQICLKFNIQKYNIYDLDPVIALANKYINKTCKNAVIESPESNLEIYSDLLISNYAFSELKREIQDRYIRNVISKSKRGFIIYNSISPKEWNSYSAIEFSKLIPNSQIIEEIPLTYPGNVIVIWGHNSN